MQLPVSKRLAALFCVSSLLAFTATSCGLVEMRDATSEILSREEMAFPTLQQAERYSEVETEADIVSVSETEAEVQEEQTRFSLAIAGGVTIDSAICNDAASRAAEGNEFSFLTMYSNIYPLVQNADMAMVTLHSPAADRETFGLSTETYTNMPAESLTALTDLGFDVINVAGVSRLICAAEGLRSTIENVCETGVMQIGAYKDDIDAGDVRVLEKDGVRVAYVAFTENANSDTGGLVLHDLTDETVAASLITYADLVSDLVVVSVTWDNGTESSVRTEQRAACQMLTEAGADVIVGTDGIGLQTAEWLTAEDGSQTFCAYSLGNLMATGTDVESVLSGLLTLDVTADAEGTVALENIQILPLVKHHNADGTGYQTAELSKYAAEQASSHGVEGLTVEAMQSVVNGIIPAAFLPGQNG
ncbi:MAG: CapA family protein [Clostridia bacterium]|nr:CapA family protein [Clostridia bacterium]